MNTVIKGIFYCTVLLIIARNSTVAQKYEPYLDYPEVALNGDNAAAWADVREDVSVGFVGTDVRPGKDEPGIVLSGEWKAVAWRGDKVHSQFAVRSLTGAAHVEASTSPLVSGDGESITEENITVSVVRYVITDGLNDEGCGCGIPPADVTGWTLSADAIDVTSACGMSARTVQPFWISVSVPRDTKAGNYKGSVAVTVDGRTFHLPFRIEVKEWTLPEPGRWKYHLDLWQNPYSVARYHTVPVWSRQHFDLMEPYMTMLAAAGQKTITVSMIHDPWRSQTYDVYSSMIKWTKGRDGAWRYDYSVFDRWVEFMMTLGIDGLINCYTMVPWNNRFYYHDEITGRDTVLVAETGTPEYEAHWEPMLRDFSRHLREKGWFGITAIAMDERPVADMKKVIDLVKKVDPHFLISLAGTYHPEIEKDIYDYCIESSDHFPPETVARRRSEGLPTTFYTYCMEGRPNTFTFSPPAESEWLAWYASATGLGGYLRWAYNCWPEYPLSDSRYSTWSAGDTYLVYPGPRSSVRFERLAEGVRNYEKIRILRDHFGRTGDSASLERLDAMLEPFRLRALDEMPAGVMIAAAKAILDSF